MPWGAIEVEMVFKKDGRVDESARKSEDERWRYMALKCDGGRIVANDTNTTND